MFWKLKRSSISARKRQSFSSRKKISKKIPTAIQTVRNAAGRPTGAAYHREPSGCVATRVGGLLPASLPFRSFEFPPTCGR